MTDARMPPKYLTDPVIADLTDRAFRVFTNGLIYAASNETDGLIPRRAARFLHPDALDLSPMVDEVVKAGLWQPHGEDYLIKDFADHQSSKAQLDGYRKQQREKKARQRSRTATVATDPPASTAWPPVAVPGGASQGVPTGTSPGVPQGTAPSVPRFDIGQDRDRQGPATTGGLTVVPSNTSSQTSDRRRSHG